MRRIDKGAVGQFQDAVEERIILLPGITILEVSAAGAADQQRVTGEYPVIHAETIAVICMAWRVHGSQRHALYGHALAIADPQEDSIGLRIEAKGSPEQREDRCIRVMNTASCGDVLSAFWATHGQEALAVLGLEGEDAATIWKGQHDAPKPFGKFLKGLDQAKALAQQKARFPTQENVGVVASMIQTYLVAGLTQGMGSVERKATARHASLDEAAAAWAWLVAVGRSGGQEWHFESNARDRGGVWAVPTTKLWSIGKQLMEAGEDEIPELQEGWKNTFDELKTITGES